MAYDETLSERIRKILQPRQEVTERKMFGGLAFMLNGNLLVGIVKDTLMARIGVEYYYDALKQPHVREMDFSGRPMKGYVFVGSLGLESDAELQYWVTLSVKFVETLAPKK